MFYGILFGEENGCLTHLEEREEGEESTGGELLPCVTALWCSGVIYPDAFQMMSLGRQRRN